MFTHAYLQFFLHTHAETKKTGMCPGRNVGVFLNEQQIRLVVCLCVCVYEWVTRSHACLPWKCPGRQCGCCPAGGRRTWTRAAGWNSSPSPMFLPGRRQAWHTLTIWTLLQRLTLVVVSSCHQRTRATVCPASTVKVTSLKISKLPRTRKTQSCFISSNVFVC